MQTDTHLLLLGRYDRYGFGSVAGSYLGDSEDSGLSIDFSRDSALVRGGSTQFLGSPTDLLTYTSPSPKLVYNSAGTLVWAPHNLLVRSQEFDNASWTKAELTISANAIAAPDGTTTADHLIESANNTTHTATSTTASFVSGFTYACTVYLKKDARSWALIGFTTAAFPTNAHAYFDLDNGLVGTKGAGAVSRSIQAVGNGWYRCTIVATADATTSTAASVFVASADNTATYAGDGTSGIYAWGAQINLGSSALTYLPTTTAARYAMPLDYHPTTGAALGVLVEEARTNLLLQSQTFGTTWVTQNATTTSDQTSAPDGTTTADKFVENGATNTHRVVSANISLTAQTYTFSGFVKVAAGTRNLSVSAWDGTVSWGVVYALSGSGSVVGAATGTTLPASSSIQSVGSGWYRVVFTFAASGVTAVADIGFYSASGSDISFTGDSASGFFIWGAQLEAGSFPTSYIPTVASQVTRAADQVSLATSAMPYSATVGSFVATVRPGTSQAAVWVGVLTDTSNWMRIAGGGTGAGFNVKVSGSLVVDIYGPAASAPIGSDTTVAAGYIVNNVYAARNGVSIETGNPDLSNSIPAVTTLVVASGIDLSALNGHIKKLKYIPRRASNAELQAMSL